MHLKNNSTAALNINGKTIAEGSVIRFSSLQSRFKSKRRKGKRLDKRESWFKFVVGITPWKDYTVVSTAPNFCISDTNGKPYVFSADYSGVETAKATLEIDYQTGRFTEPEEE